MMVFHFCPGMTVGINFSMLDSDHSCRTVGRDEIYLLLLSRRKEVTKKGRPRVIGCSCLPLRSPTGAAELAPLKQSSPTFRLLPRSRQPDKGGPILRLP